MPSKSTTSIGHREHNRTCASRRAREARQCEGSSPHPCRLTERAIVCPSPPTPPVSRRGGLVAGDASSGKGARRGVREEKALLHSSFPISSGLVLWPTSTPARQPPPSAPVMGSYISCISSICNREAEAKAAKQELGLGLTELGEVDLLTQGSLRRAYKLFRNADSDGNGKVSGDLLIAPSHPNPRNETQNLHPSLALSPFPARITSRWALTQPTTDTHTHTHAHTRTRAHFHAVFWGFFFSFVTCQAFYFSLCA